MEVRVIANRGLAFGFFRFFARRNGAGLEGSLGGTDAPRSSGLELVERKVSGRRAFWAGAGGRIIAVPFPLKRGHWRLCGTELLTAEFAEEVAEDAEKSKRCSGTGVIVLRPRGFYSAISRSRALLSLMNRRNHEPA